MTFIAIDRATSRARVVHYDPARKAVAGSYYEDNHATISVAARAGPFPFDVGDRK